MKKVRGFLILNKNFYFHKNQKLLDTTLGLIGSAVLTFIGNKQTDKQSIYTEVRNLIDRRKMLK